MRRLLLLATLTALPALVATAPATAKGPSTAALTGPGLSRALTVKGIGEVGVGTPLGALVQYGGYFAQVFNQIPDPTLRTPPSGSLGPRYRVIYLVPGPNGGVSTIFQDVYPYARPHSLTHMLAGQRFWNGMHTHGGWFVSGPQLKATLVEAGLPKSPPAPGASFPWAWTGAGAAAFAVLLLLTVRMLGVPRLRVLRSTA
jgi:hypothetical protein